MLFDTVHRIDFEKLNSFILTIICCVSNYSMGIYIFHVMVIWGAEKVLANYYNIAPILLMPILVCLSIVISLVATKIIRKIPFLNRFV